METTTQLINGTCAVRLVGRFDSFHVNQVRQALEKNHEQCVQVVINLRGVNFMDSSAVAVLVQEMKHTRKNGGDLRLCEMQDAVQVIFKLTRLDKAFQIFATEAEALASFAHD